MGAPIFDGPTPAAQATASAGFGPGLLEKGPCGLSLQLPKFTFVFGFSLPLPQFASSWPFVFGFPPKFPFAFSLCDLADTAIDVVGTLGYGGGRSSVQDPDPDFFEAPGGY